MHLVDRRLDDVELRLRLRARLACQRRACEEDEGSDSVHRRLAAQGTVVTSMRDGRAASWYTRIVAFMKSAGAASKILGTNFCGFRSVSGNHELCTCTMIR